MKKVNLLVRVPLVSALLVCLSACVEQTRPPSERMAEVTVQDEWIAHRRVMEGEAQMRPWLAYYQQRIPDLRLGDFQQLDSFAVDSFYSFPYTPNPVFAPLFVPNEAETFFLDVVSYERTIDLDANGTRIIVAGSPDNSALLVDPASALAQRLMFCGTPCVFQDAAWLSDTEVAVMGLNSHLKLNFQPTIWYINLLEKEVSIFTHPQEVLPGDFRYLEYQLNQLEGVRVD